MLPRAVAAGADPVVLAIDLQVFTERWMTPQDLPYEDHLEFEIRVAGTVVVSPGRTEGDQWVSTEAQYDLNTHLVGTATLSADADPLLRNVQRAFSAEGRLLNVIYRTEGSVRLGLESESRGYRSPTPRGCS